MDNLTVKDLKPGDILLSPPPPFFKGGWMGQIIVKITNGTTSHGALYIGPINGKPTIAHAYVRGIEHLSLKDHFEVDNTPSCFVRRRDTPADLSAVLEAAEKYVQSKSPLAKESFVILGLILLSKRFSQNRLRNPVLHRFVTMLCIKLRKILAGWLPNRTPDDNAMNCSQFVLQCFKDAGDDYKINFDRLKLEYDRAEGFLPLKSLIDYINISEPLQNNEGLMQTDNEELSPEILSPEEEKIVNDFIKMLDGSDQESSLIEVDDKFLQDNSTELARLIYILITGKDPHPGEDIDEFLLSNRDYIALPDDLLLNTQDLTDAGQITRSSLN